MTLLRRISKGVEIEFDRQREPRFATLQSVMDERKLDSAPLDLPTYRERLENGDCEE
jgi:hypothetical protein